MTVLDPMGRFTTQFGKYLFVDGMRWRYHRLGVGTPVLGLTGGLRRVVRQLPQQQQAELAQVITATVRAELTRADVISLSLSRRT